MSAKKAVEDTDIPFKVLIENAEFFTEQICRQFKEAICSSKFPATFKFANVIPFLKQGTRNLKHNYRQISILPIISKIFEKLTCRRLSSHFIIFSEFQCGFRKGFNAQDCLLLMIDKWEKAVDNSKAIGAFLTDLSKAFDLPRFTSCKTTCLWIVTSCLENDLRLPSESKTKSQNLIFLQYMREHYIWCSIRLYFRTPLAQHLFT